MDQLLAKKSVVAHFSGGRHRLSGGQGRVFGASLGTAAVLFVGLGFGMFNPHFEAPTIVFQLGLILFVYSVGISSGPAFLKPSRKMAFGIWALFCLASSFLHSLPLYFYLTLHLDKSTVVGVYCGSTTNTPALAGVTDLINRLGNRSKNNGSKTWWLVILIHIPWGFGCNHCT